MFSSPVESRSDAPYTNDVNRQESPSFSRLVSASQQGEATADCAGMVKSNEERLHGWRLWMHNSRLLEFIGSLVSLALAGVITLTTIHDRT